MKVYLTLAYRPEGGVSLERSYIKMKNNIIKLSKTGKQLKNKHLNIIIIYKNKMNLAKRITCETIWSQTNIKKAINGYTWVI